MMEQHQQTVAQPQPQPQPQFADVHLTPAANPTPTQPQLSSSHPSYAVMIQEAITWYSSQGKAGGSSKRAISKYMERVYTNLPPNHSALLSHHLRRLKSSGNVVMIKNSYQLPALAYNATPTSAAVATRSVEDTTPKRRPGRPPKPKVQAQDGTTVANGNGKRPRGRPPRQQPAVAEVPFVHPVSTGLNNGKEVVKKRPGRPPKKQKQQHRFAQPVYDTQVQGASQSLVAVVNGTVAKRRPGRPPGAKNLTPRPPPAAPRPRGRGRPKRSALGPVSRAIGKRPRGRPPRNQAAAPGVGVGVRAGGRGRGRGRPPKGSVSAAAGPTKPKSKPNPVRKYTGKPRGRPKKNAIVVGTQSSELIVANEEAMKKVENMQATVRDAVGVLRPYLANENAAEVLKALQELEDVSAMNIDGSPAQTEPLMTDMSMNATVQVQPTTSVPEPEGVSAPPEASITIQTVGPPVPFSITAPAITETAQPLFAQPSTIGIQQPTSWIPSSEAQL